MTIEGLRGARWWVIALLAILSLGACDKGGDDPAGSEGAAEPVEPVAVVLAVEAGGVTPAVSVAMQLPGNWHADDFFEGTWLPDTSNSPMETGLRAETSCGGVCDAAEIATNIEAEMAGSLADRWAQGSSEAHFQPTVELIEAGAFDNGRFHAYRVSYPPAPEGEAAPRPGTHLECYLHNSGDAFYVVLEATARPENEAEIWPALREHCLGASYTTAAQ